MSQLFKKLVSSLCALAVVLPTVPAGAATTANYSIRVPVTSTVHVATTTDIDFGNLLVGTSGSRVITFTNRGTDATTIRALTTQGQPVKVTDSTCTVGLSLASQATCSFKVSLTPTAVGRYDAVVQLAHSAAALPDTYALHSTGVDAATSLRFDQSWLQFDGQTVNTESKSKPLVLKNHGQAPVSVESIAVVDGAGYFRVDTNECERTLAPGATCPVSVVFAPRLLGVANARLVIVLEDGSKITGATLSGAGVQGVASWSASTLNFRDLTVGKPSATQTVILANAGSGDMTIDSLSVTGDSSFSLVSTDCPKVLPAQRTCEVALRVTPQDKDVHTAALTLEASKAATRVTRVQLVSQAGVEDSRLEWNPLALDFGKVTVGSSATLPLTLKAVGNAAVVVDRYRVAGAGAADFVINNASACTGTLSPGMQCTLMVKVAPTSDTLREASIQVDGTATAPFTDVPLKAAGQAGRLVALPGELAVPSTDVGKTSSVVVTLSNPGTAAVTIASPEYSSDLGGTVTAAGCAGTNLDPGRTCAVTLTFKPTKVGALSGSVLWFHTGAGPQARVNLSATGRSAALPAAELDPFICNPAPAAVGMASTCTSTLRNIGEVPVTVGAWSRTNTTFGMPSSDCGTTLAVGAKCVATLRVTPTTAGTISSYVSVGTGAGTLSVPASLSSQTPSATLTPWQHGTVLVGSTDVRTHTLANNGSLPVKVTMPASMALLNTMTVSSSSATTCTNSQTLNPGESCQVATVCAPSAVGKLTNTLRVSTTAGLLTGSLSCTGEAPPPSGSQIQATPNPLNFGNVPVGGLGSTQVLQVSNRGVTSMTLTGASVSGVDASDFTITSNLCVKTLAPGTSCLVYVKAIPKTPGPHEASLTLKSTAATPVPTIGLRSNGTQGVLSLAPTDYNFDSVAVGSTKLQAVTVQNVGTASLRVDNVLLQGTNVAQFRVLNNYCLNTTLPPGGKCSVSVVFAPQADQPAVAQLSVISSTASPSTVTASLQGRGYIPPVAKGTLTAQPNCSQAVQFGQRPACTMVLRSTGSADLVVSGFTLRRTQGDFMNTSTVFTSARDFTDITGGSFDTASGKLTLPPGATASVTHLLSPYASSVPGSAPMGPLSYQSFTITESNLLTLTSNATLAVSGTETFKVTAPVFELTAAPASLSTQVKQTGTSVVTLRNRGIDGVKFTAPSRVVGYAPNAAWFASAGDTCSGSTLAPGEACTSTLACTPSALGLTGSASVQFMSGVDFIRADGSHAVYALPQSRTVSCTGVAATGTITSPNGKLSSLVATGSQSGNWRRFTNTGSGPVTITEIVGSADFLLYTDAAQANHCKVGMQVAAGQSCDFLEVVLKENVSGTAFNLSRNHYLRTNAGTFSWPANYAVLGLNVLTTSTDTSTMQRGSSRTLTLVLQNYTPSALADLQFITSPGTSVKETTCTVLNSSGNCSVTLLVAPQAAATVNYYTASLEVRGRFNRVYNQQVGPAAAVSTAAKFSRTWTLTNPTVAVVPTPCNVCRTGTRPGSYTDFDWPIINNGQEPIVFTGPPRVDGDVYFSVIRTTCQIALAAGRSCSPTIRFAPTPGVWGPRYGTLVIPTSGGNLSYPISAIALPRGSVSVRSTSSNPAPSMNSSTDYSTVVTNTSVDGAPAQVTLNIASTVTPLSSAVPDVRLTTPQCFVTGVGSTCSIQGNTAVFNLAPGGTGTIRQHVTYGIVPCKHSYNTSAIVNGVYDDNVSDDNSAISFDIGKGRLITNSSGARYWSDGSAATSCQSYRAGDGLHEYAGDTGSGYYVVDPDGSGPLAAAPVWCDMTTDGGGWTCPHSEDVATASKTWYSTVNDRGLSYNQLLLNAGSEHSMDYSVPWSNNQWNSRGLSIAQTVLQFDSKGYVSRSTPAWRGCGASETGSVTLPGRATGYLPDSAYRNLSAQNECQFGAANAAGQCSSQMTVNVPYNGARLRAIGDLESAAGACTDDNLVRRQYSVCFRYNPNVTPAEVAEPKVGIIQVGGTRTWFDGALATSCRAYRKGDGGAGHLYQGATGDGTYRIDTDGSGPLPAVDVWCDMTSDNGAGYTELAQSSGGARHARDAEAQCAQSGLQLFVPRSDQHFASARSHFGVQNFALMGIYPKYRGATCQGSSLHSGSCAGWGPLNGGAWFVQSGVSVSEPNGDNDTDGSMLYSYQNGNVSWYNDISDSNGGGYTAGQFVCSARDEGGVAASSVASVSQAGSRGSLSDIGRNRSWAVPQNGAVWLWPDSNAANGDMGAQSCMQTSLNNNYGSSIGVTLTGAADNWADLFIDGAGVGRLPGYGDITSVTTSVAPGRHVLRAMVYNGGGPAGLTLWATRSGTGEILNVSHPSSWTRCD